MWVLYVGLGATATLVISALLLVRLHFCLKNRGYNLLFRSQNNPPAASSKIKNSDKINSTESDIQLIEAENEQSSEKVDKGRKNKGVATDDAAVTLL